MACRDAIGHVSGLDRGSFVLRLGMFRSVKGEMLSVKKAKIVISRCILEYYKNILGITYLPQIFLRWKTNV